MSALSRSEEYTSFRRSIPLQRLTLDPNSEHPWLVYDTGPKSVRCPLICLAPASGTADTFYKQLLGLSAYGYRVVAVDYPPIWKHDEWCRSFRQLLDHLQFDKVHIFGASLGGFLAQKFAEYTYKSPRVESLFLCNAFSDTTVFRRKVSSTFFWAMPSFVLKRMILSNMPSHETEPLITDSTDFIVERLENLERSQLASRMTLNCTSAYVEPQKLRDVSITIMDVFDDSALTASVKEDLYKCYPNAKRAHLKSGGNFPYLSRGSEVNMHLNLHLRVFDDTKYRAKHADAKTPEPCDDVDVSDGEEDGEEDGETEQAEAAVAAFS
ncbi:maspardin-like [Oscarella lobularis]|uniref:maspardin-like n=1 Tax=Oscarella lobularis TaxID=121494 RepID=UPI003313C4C7